MIYLNKNFLLSCEELSGTYYYKVLNLLINYVKWKGKFKVENKFKNKRATESDKFLFFVKRKLFFFFCFETNTFEAWRGEVYLFYSLGK